MIITVARKRVEDTIIKNLVKMGCGGLNLAASQTPFVSELDREESLQKNRHGDWDSAPPINNGIYSEYKRRGSELGNYCPEGRHASNFILSWGVSDALFPYITHKGKKLFSSRVYRRIK